jgi:phage shock protein A
MAGESVFKELGPSQLHYLKSQYLASHDLLDQTEAALKAQLEQVTKARHELERLSRELDSHIEQPRTRKTAEPAKRAGKRV